MSAYWDHVVEAGTRWGNLSVAGAEHEAPGVGEGGHPALCAGVELEHSAICAFVRIRLAPLAARYKNRGPPPYQDGAQYLTLS